MKFVRPDVIPQAFYKFLQGRTGGQVVNPILRTEPRAVTPAKPVERTVGDVTAKRTGYGTWDVYRGNQKIGSERAVSNINNVLSKYTKPKPVAAPSPAPQAPAPQEERLKIDQMQPLPPDFLNPPQKDVMAPPPPPDFSAPSPFTNPELTARLTQFRGRVLDDNLISEIASLFRR